MSKPTVNALFDELLRAYQGSVDKVPKGHLTVEQWAQKWGLKSSRARQLINAGIDKKIMAKAVFRVNTNRGVYPTPYYYQIKKG